MFFQKSGHHYCIANVTAEKISTLYCVAVVVSSSAVLIEDHNIAGSYPGTKFPEIIFKTPGIRIRYRRTQHSFYWRDTSLERRSSATRPDMAALGSVNVGDRSAAPPETKMKEKSHGMEWQTTPAITTTPLSGR